MKTLKKILSLALITCMLGGLLISASGCGIFSRTAGTVDGEDIPAGMYIYFLHSAIYSLEQQYQYGNLSSEYSESSEESSVEESSVESSVEESSVESSAQESTETSASESSSDTQPETLWDAIVDNKTAKEYVIDQAYRNCAWVIVMEKKAVEYGIEFSEEDQAELDEDYENNGGKTTLEETLNDMGVALSTYERIVKASIIQEHLKELLYGTEGKEEPISQDELKKEYDDNYRRVKHILFKTSDLSDITDDDGNVTKTVDEQKAEIEATYKDVLARAKKGENFEDLVNEYSDDSMDVDKGYIFTKDEMVDEFEEAAWDLAVGNITSCESSYGWHIIKAYDKYEDESYMTDTLSDYISDYIDNKYSPVESEWIDAVVVKRNSAASSRYSPAKIYKDNEIASSVSAQIEYYNSYYSALMANQ